MSAIVRFTLAIAFAALAAGLAFGFEAGFFYAFEQITHERLSPRGAGWGIFIIVAAVAGWKTGYHATDDLSLLRLFASAAIETRNGRKLIVLLSGWLIGWTLWANAFFGRHSYECNFNCGYEWDVEAWAHYLGGLIAGPLVVMLAYLTIRWIKAGK